LLMVLCVFFICVRALDGLAEMKKIVILFVKNLCAAVKFGRKKQKQQWHFFVDTKYITADE
jgi:hypothetical protein